MLHLTPKPADHGLVRKRPRIGDILLEAGLVTDEQLQQAIDLQHERGGRLGQILLEENMVAPIELLRSLASQFGVEYVDLDDESIDPQAVAMISPTLARRHRALPIRWEDETLVVAMTNPADLFALDDIRATTRTPVKAVMVEGSQLHEAISRWSQDILPTGGTQRPGGPPVSDTAHIRFVDVVLSRAVAERASDVHLEPCADGLRVRFRVDGVMHELFTAPRGAELGVLSRLKVIAGMDISERRIPQDGRCTHEVDGEKVDIRVATVPTINGEAAVIRILDRAAEVANLDELGFLPENLNAVRAAARRPWGAILVAGPTGSGKTTTLYAILRELNTPERNIMTIEDPVEITLDGIKQVQVHTRAGLTFASALRSFLRADPDVMLVGEIRDPETATIAAEASLTGHLVLSSIHTNDAAGTPLRLLEMGVEPFLVSSSLSAIVAQRLARRLCERCREEYKPDDGELMALGWTGDRLLEGDRPVFHRAIGCPSCSDTGYRGRMAIHEVMVVTEEIASLISRKAPADQVRAVAISQGMRTLRQDGVMKIADGLTSVEELFRVLA